MRVQTMLVAVALVCAAINPAASQSTDPGWLDDLSEQLAQGQQCKVEYFVNIREGQLAGRATFEARAQCRDGRRFDAARTAPDQSFTISLCEQSQVC